MYTFILSLSTFLSPSPLYLVEVVRHPLLSLELHIYFSSYVFFIYIFLYNTGDSLEKEARKIAASHKEEGLKEYIQFRMQGIFLKSCRL